MIDLQLPVALGVVMAASGLLLRGPVSALVRSRRPAPVAPAAPTRMGGCGSCPASGGCSKRSC